jgi:S1-C subfamily serine protease
VLGHADGTPLPPDLLFKKASPAVAQVETRKGDDEYVRQGSGFLVSQDGLIATNYHVIRGAHRGRVIFGNGSTFPVEGVAAADPEADLAILKIEGNEFTCLELAPNELPAIGSKVFAIGSPLGLTNSLSEGLVSAHRSLGGYGSGLIQTTASISHGSSGGPLLRPDGKVVGVTTLHVREGEGLNFAVRVEELSRRTKVS